MGKSGHEMCLEMAAFPVEVVPEVSPQECGCMLSETMDLVI